MWKGVQLVAVMISLPAPTIHLSTGFQAVSVSRLNLRRLAVGIEMGVIVLAFAADPADGNNSGVTAIRKTISKSERAKTDPVCVHVRGL